MFLRDTAGFMTHSKRKGTVHVFFFFGEKRNASTTTLPQNVDIVLKCWFYVIPKRNIVDGRFYFFVSL